MKVVIRTYESADSLEPIRTYGCKYLWLSTSGFDVNITLRRFLIYPHKKPSFNDKV